MTITTDPPSRRVSPLHLHGGGRATPAPSSGDCDRAIAVAISKRALPTTYLTLHSSSTPAPAPSLLVDGSGYATRSINRIDDRFHSRLARVSLTSHYPIIPSRFHSPKYSGYPTHSPLLYTCNGLCHSVGVLPNCNLSSVPVSCARCAQAYTYSIFSVFARALFVLMPRFLLESSFSRLTSAGESALNSYLTSRAKDNSLRSFALLPLPSVTMSDDVLTTSSHHYASPHAYPV
ncbi:hypothetical protein BOTBODRAFT_276582 [Botryobasidium botryosum FD-172 SS1]|uniref:Uncharacterized protein n=1 Tax=Botryobasidium botryosum (strain FD-172 SS1) TaxID=930990 RepID=A0A067MVN9_BOTB1|nr:hypothetical protein BOTBODRAFT_276582 [Botryobasidium botryosum FD-172 SS1]